ncbi:hypothetical protein C8F01DRAFT_996282 [Mycena amicta]|nr:hypothetical protein C8F01DRAFT_996282 [Mycena amicta]
MKFAATILATIAFAASALAQVTLIAPTSGASVTAGSSVTVRVVGTTPTAGSVQGAAVIAITKCTLICNSPLNNIGTVLYNGNYNPVFHLTGPGPARTVYQDIAVTIPSGSAAGNWQISIVHPTFTSVSPRRRSSAEIDAFPLCKDGSQLTYEVDSVVVAVS